jgi:hypothetical protein
MVLRRGWARENLAALGVSREVAVLLSIFGANELSFTPKDAGARETMPLACVARLTESNIDNISLI